MDENLRGGWATVELYGWWLLILAALVAVLVRIYTLSLYAALRLLDSTWRPVGWTIETLNGYGPFMILILGMVWLMGVYYVEGALRSARSLSEMRVTAGRWLFGCVGVFVVCTLVLWVGG